MKNRLFLLYLPLISILLFSCESVDHASFDIIDTGIDYPLHTIEIFDGQCFVSGGNTWTRSDVAISDDGNTWAVDSLSDKSILDLHVTENGELLGVGLDGYLLSGPEFENNRQAFWGILRSIIDIDGCYITVGGKGWNDGYIYVITEELKTDTAYFFDFELRDVALSEDGVLSAVGYGVILVSEDEGQSWSQSTMDGDFYTSIAYNSIGEGYIVGHSGSILVSSDGKNWGTKENGHPPFNNNRFNKIKFNGNEIGAIVGDDGLLWVSMDNGVTWQNRSLDYNQDLFDFVFWNNKIYATSEDGVVVAIEY